MFLSSTKLLQGFRLKRCLSTIIYPSSLDIYTDGSCVDNGKVYARGGIGVYFPHNEHKNLSQMYDMSKWIFPPTSQRCELVAIYEALTIHDRLFSDRRCRVYTDSDYAIRCLISYGNIWSYNGWKKTNGQPVKNIDLLNPMVQLYKKNSENIRLVFVKAHTNARTIQSMNNNVADALAKRGTIS